MAVLPDGGHLVFSKHDSVVGEIMLAEDFR
jgi:hypothetical protein